MNWYKISQKKLENFFDRNVINHQIEHFSKLAENLIYLGELVFQTATGTKIKLNEIINDKKLSSFPEIKHNLKVADNIIYDNPWKFSEMCNTVAEVLISKVKKMKKERKYFINGEDPFENKGLR